MKYLLDTNIIINHFRKKKAIDITMLKASAGISIITLGELQYGAYKSTKTQHNLDLIENFLQDFAIEVLPLTKEIMQEYAKTKAILEKHGNSIEDFDLFIAVTAKLHNLIVITANLRHFQRIPGIQIAK